MNRISILMTLISSAILLGIFACEPDDSYNCPLGFVPDETAGDDGFYIDQEDGKAVKKRQCTERQPSDYIPDPDTGTDTDTDTDSDVDGGGDADTDADGDGFGVPCSTDDECKPYSATDYCAINPLTKEGACSLRNCTPADCPATYECCDCTNTTSDLLPKEKACLTSFEASVVLSYECTCEAPPR